MILPAPPFKVSRGFVKDKIVLALFLGLFGLGIAAGSSWLAFKAGRSAISDASVWSQGVSAPEVRVEGKEKSSHFFFMNYQLDVDYTDARGQRHRGRTEFDTLFGSVDQASDPEVHYLEDRPSVFALSWGRDVLPYRWMSIGLFSLVGLGTLGGWLTLVTHLVREQQAVRACSRRAVEVELTVVNTKVEQNRVVYELEGRNPLGGVLKESFVANPQLGDPFFLGKGQDKVLGLVSPDLPHRVVVLRDSLMPFEFSAVDVRRIHQKVGRASQQGEG